MCKKNRIKGILKRNILLLPEAFHNQKGTGLVEVLVAMFILSSVGLIAITGLSAGSKAIGTMSRDVIADNIAQYQLEYTKEQPYIAVPVSYNTISDLPADFTVSVQAASIPNKDNNIQIITVKVYKNGKLVLTREGYKLRR